MKSNIKALIEGVAGVKFNKNNKTCCMFHNEKTPSFSVDEKKNMWKCFGCNKGGDAIQFLREYKGLNYAEACEELGIKSIKIAREDEKGINDLDDIERIIREQPGKKINK